MAHKLSKRSVDALIRKARKERRDRQQACPVLDGFMVRATAGGSAFYYYRAPRAYHAKRKRYPLGKHGPLTVEEARAKAKKYAAMIADGRDPAAEQRKRRDAPTMADLWDEYWEGHAQEHKRDPKKDLQLWRKHVAPVWSEANVSEIKRARVKALVDAVGRKKHRGRRTRGAANKVLALVSKMFSYAKDDLLWIESNPASGLARLAKKGGAKYARPDVRRPLSQEEVGAVLDAMDAKVAEASEQHRATAEQGRAAILFVLFTGMRHHEALGLRWSDLTLGDDGGSWRGADKGDAGPRPLSGEAVEILRSLPRPEVGGVYCFPSPKDSSRPRASLDSFWRDVRERAGLGGVRVHDLRHTAGVAAAMHGAGTFEIKEMLGHRSAAMAEYYAKVGRDAASRGQTGVAAFVAGAEKKRGKVRRIRRRGR